MGSGGLGEVGYDDTTQRNSDEHNPTSKDDTSTSTSDISKSNTKNTLRNGKEKNQTTSDLNTVR